MWKAGMRSQRNTIRQGCEALGGTELRIEIKDFLGGLNSQLF